jgi:putative membrane protein insertion efficiency factor
MKMGRVRLNLKGLVFILIHIYKNTFSIIFGPCCRFTPSCSSYALLSIQRFGVVKGAKLTFKRLIRCHPFNPGGYDPVPDIPAKF